MKEISLHILDLIQNSIQADAKRVILNITENSTTDVFTLKIEDNGIGMNEQMIESVLDPFFTTKGKKTGLGIPLLKQHAEQTGGSISIESQKGKGTSVIAQFGLNHIDRQPLGDMVCTLAGLIRAYPDIDFEYYHRNDNKKFSFKTAEIKQELDGIPITSPEVISFIKELLTEQLIEIT